MLNLPGLNVVNVADRQGDYLLEANVNQEVPVCECADPHVVANGRKPQEFVDTPMHGKRVDIVVKRQRYKCQGCGRTYYADIPNMHSKHRMTQRRRPNLTSVWRCSFPEWLMRIVRVKSLRLFVAWRLDAPNFQAHRKAVGGTCSWVSTILG